MPTLNGIDPARLTDDVLSRELTHLHETRHDAVLHASQDALQAHTQRMLALEEEFVKRFARKSAPDPMRTRAGSRKAAGQPDTPPAATDDKQSDPSQAAIVAAHPQNEDVTEAE